MSILQQQILEEKFENLLHDSDSIYIYHYNTKKTRDWIKLKNLFLQKNIKVQQKIMNLRWVIEQLAKQNQNDDFMNIQIDSPTKNENLAKIQKLGGRICFFFCQNEKRNGKSNFDFLEVAEILRNHEFSQDFILLGVLQRNKNHFSTEEKYTFFSMYDMEKFFEIKKNQSLNPFENLYSQLKSQQIKSLNFLEIHKIHLGALSLWNQNQYTFLQILNLLSKKKAEK